MLGLTPHQVVIALGELVTTGFLEAEPADTGWQLHRICPLTRQVLGHWADHVPGSRIAAIDQLTVRSGWKR